MKEKGKGWGWKVKEKQAGKRGRVGERKDREKGMKIWKGKEYKCIGKIQLVKMEKDKRKVKGKGKRKGVKGRERRDLFSSP